MNQPVLVREIKRVSDLRAHPQSPLRAERPIMDQRLQVAALDVAHRHKQVAVTVSGLVDRDDVRVVEARRQLRLSQKTLPKPVVQGERRRQQLERHRTAQARVLAQVDDAHPAAAQQPLDPVPEQFAVSRKL